MWRMTPRLATATLTATLALALATIPEAGAATVQSYSYTTDGSISGPYNGPITFVPQNYNSSLTTPGSLVLGQFFTNPLPPTATLTYNNTPFTIDLNILSANTPRYYGYGNGYGSLSYQYQISGMLNGTIGGDGTSSMMASITSITGNGFGQVGTPPFPISALQINVPQGIAPPNGSTQGVTTLTAQVLVAGLPLPTPAPEPSTIAVFGVALAGWACHRRSRSKARRGAA